MTKYFTYAAIVIVLGATAMLASSSRNVTASAGVEARFAADGAFRDGLYLGKLAAEGGRPSRPATGRWSNDQDRSRFTAGYRRGYDKQWSVARGQ